MSSNISFKSVYLASAISLIGMAGTAQAALNSPISFIQAGTVSLTLDSSAGGFDHILEMASDPGSIGTPLMALTDNLGTPSSDVLGYTPANLGDIINLGSFNAGDELIFRLTSVESIRLGTPGTLADQIFTGTSSGNNPNPTDYYTYVDLVDPFTIKVYFEDLFGVPTSDPDPVTAFFDGGYDVAFTLTMTPVPVPAAAWLLGSGLLGLFGAATRRRA